MSNVITLKNLPHGERGAFSTDPLNSPTLPSRYYTDKDIYDEELKKVHQRAWNYVGHITDVPEPGSYITDVVAGQPIVIVKGHDEVIRAFYNVCAHRGHELLTGSGKLKGKGIVCPYHAWLFKLDGSLFKARHTETIKDFDLSQFSLRDIPIAFSAGLIFVNFDQKCEPLEASMSDLGISIQKYLPDIENFVAAHRLNYDINANWKVVVDNFSEAYHIPVAHPQLSKVLEQDAADFQLEERWTFNGFRSRTGFEGFELEPGLPYCAWQAWPNICVLSLPGSENLIVLRMSPNGVDKCAERVDVYTPKGDAENDPKLLAVRDLFMNMFNQEDIAIVESVQRGLSSLGYDQGRYVCDAGQSWFTEAQLHWLHMQVLEALEKD
ncbi:MAG: phenylpropionate dioxygenase-like ring-hydroxylating dioxygenase large terminal subunit [Gammaproteobacteria bacterium]|jgi:phenylpropionate dioxygenase-like ring-hydroxylating dioxygenase large terminal subunit